MTDGHLFVPTGTLLRHTTNDKATTAAVIVTIIVRHASRQFTYLNLKVESATGAANITAKRTRSLITVYTKHAITFSQHHFSHCWLVKR